jgi:murein DD-endopeptidase MepM/ murein hydrolase activator NlpD
LDPGTSLTPGAAFGPDELEQTAGSREQSYLDQMQNTDPGSILDADEEQWDASWRNVPVGELPEGSLPAGTLSEENLTEATLPEGTLPDEALSEGILPDDNLTSDTIAQPDAETAADVPAETEPEITTAAETPEQNLSMFNQDSNQLAYAEDLARPIFNHFTAEDTMDWPLFGEVVMDYSTATGVFDETLQEWHTNDGICISAPEGTQVRASADGIVTKVEKTFAEGNIIVIDNGNGWSTTYSQLQDGMLVNEGDVVKTGDIIGGVGSPSIYKVMMGSHLDFKVTKDDATINPRSLLAQE